MTLEKIRNRINKIDNSLINLLSERMSLARDVAIIKGDKGGRIIDERREKELIDRLVSEGKSQNLDEHFLKKLFFEIIDESVRVQKKYILDNENNADTNIN